MMELLDFRKMCRLCLSKHRPLTRVFSENTEPSTLLAQTIVACVGIQEDALNEDYLTVETRPPYIQGLFDIEPGDNLPDKICNTCLDELDRWQRFKKLCEWSNEELITGMPPLSDEVLEKNLQKNSSDNNLETSSDFGFGDVSLLERDSLFNSIDVYRDGNIVANDLIMCKTFSTLFKTHSENNDICNQNEEDLEKRAEESALEENSRRKLKEKYTRVYMNKYKCEICLKEFSKFAQLLQHDRTGHKAIPLTEICEKCERLFISKERLNVHLKMKHGDKKFKCDVCGLQCVSEKSLKVHKVRHNGRHMCNICGLATNSNRSLQDHKLVHVAAPDRPVYTCNVCNASFKNKQTLDSHLIKHETDKPEFKCQMCNKEFKKKEYLKKHKESHSSQKSAVCEECGAVLKNNFTLRIHKLNHKQRQHFCQVCDKAFATKNLLTRHMLVHMNKSYVCSMCNQCFRRNDGLKRHLKTHRGSLECKTLTS